MTLFSKFQPPEEVPSKLNAAYDLMQQNRFSEALCLLNGIIEQVPDNANALTCRGEAYGRLGNISAALADLEQSICLKPTAPAYFNYALAHLYSENQGEALAALFRAVQLEPKDQRARSLRETLAQDLGLENLEKIARVVEQFMYAQCGPGTGWKVELRQMYRFMPNKPHEKYNAVFLDLCQQPLTFIQIQDTQPEYIVMVNCEKLLVNAPRPTFSDVVTKAIPADNALLLEVFHSFIKDGVLIKAGNCLRYGGH